MYRIRLSPKLRAKIPGFPAIQDNESYYMTIRLRDESSGWWDVNEGRLNVVTVNTPLQAVELLLELSDFHSEDVEPDLDKESLEHLYSKWKSSDK